LVYYPQEISITPHTFTSAETMPMPKISSRYMKS